MSATAMTEFDEAEETELVHVDTNAIAAITKTEVEAQLDSAHKYPRSINRFRQEALSMATVSEEVAQSCIYSLPRGGKPITGPSVRLAEICASAWGNIHVGARPVEVGETEVTSQGVAWDLQKNFRVTVESKRRITSKNGQRFNEDMIIMTQNAANSIALRNAIFRVIPRAYVDQIYARVREVAIGNASTLSGKRATVLEKLAKMGADQVRVLAALGKAGVDDIGLEELETLIGYGTAIKEGTRTVDEVFPPPAKDVPGATPAEQGKRMSLGKPKGKATAASEGASGITDGALPTREAMDELNNLRSHVQIDEETIAGWFGKTAFGQFTAADVSEALVRLNHVDNGGRLNSKGEIIQSADKAAEDTAGGADTAQGQGASKPAGGGARSRGGK